MSIQSILVVKPSSLGDVVHTLPAVSLVRQHWPDARLRWLINPEWAPLLEGNPDVDEIVLFPRKELGASFAKTVQWMRTMRLQYRSGLVLDFQGLLRSAFVGRLCTSQICAGLSDAREGSRLFYNRVAKVAKEHAVDRYLKLVREVGVPITKPLQWNLPPGEKPVEFDENAPFVLLHPFSRGVGKSLSVEEVESFCRGLGGVIVLAGRSEVSVPEIAGIKVINLLNRTSISQLIWLIRKARFVVSVDSGPMHIAAAITPRLLSIHTWSDPALVGPYNPEAWIWKERTLYQVRDIHSTPAKRQAAPDIESIAASVRNLAG